MKISPMNDAEKIQTLLQHNTPQQLQEDAGGLLLRYQNPNMGQLVASERAAFYLNILYSLLLFRRSHELEPLNEDIFSFVLSAQQNEADGSYDATLFNQDMRQLEQWDLISKRIERERLRGYKDSRRQKFRFRISPQALSFLQWVEDQLREVLEPERTDTRNLLEEVAGGVRELLRTLNQVQKTNPDLEKARSATYRLARLGRLTIEINQSLADFNAQLTAFTLERYEIDTARALIRELEHFLESYINRIQILRKEIIPEFEKLASPRLSPRWELCRTVLEEEARNASMLLSTRSIPAAKQEIERLIRFYEVGGQLDHLCARVRSSALGVWRKLSTHLRELERKSHRMEDLKDRISEMATCSADATFSEFITELIAPARMMADMHYWDAAEKADPPQPRLEQHTTKQTPIRYLTPKPKGDSAEVRSLNDEKLDRLREWLEKTHTNWPAALSQGTFTDFTDHAAVIEFARYGLLGSGRNLAKRNLKMEPTSIETDIEIDERILRFKELIISLTNRETPDEY